MINPVSAFVLYAFVWFLTLFVVLPIGTRTQAEEGDVVPGTPRSAPANARMKRKLVITTVAGTIIWAILAGIIWSRIIKVEMFDWLHGA